jgi:hypothetical protein
MQPEAAALGLLAGATVAAVGGLALRRDRLADRARSVALRLRAEPRAQPLSSLDRARATLEALLARLGLATIDARRPLADRLAPAGLRAPVALPLLQGAMLAAD